MCIRRQSEPVVAQGLRPVYCVRTLVCGRARARPASAGCGGRTAALAASRLRPRCDCCHNSIRWKRSRRTTFCPSAHHPSGTLGCNLACAWCQNWENLLLKTFDPETEYSGRAYRPGDCCRLSCPGYPARRGFYQPTGGLSSNRSRHGQVCGWAADCFDLEFS